MQKNTFMVKNLHNQKKHCIFATVLKRGSLILLFMLVLCMQACRPPAVPKPYGYFRIAIPDTSYTTYSPLDYPYVFMVSKNAEILVKDQEGEKYWIDIYYPLLNTTIHCSYKPIQNNLRSLSRDAQEFIFNHATIASSIPEQSFANPQQNVYGVYYELHGNTATPLQFVLTDSIAHFFRGSVYCNDVPNQDSLAPIVNYMRHDVRRLMESLQWKDMK